MLHKNQKALTQTHKKASLLQRPKPHHLMNCERAVRQRRAALSQFGGRGGTLSPPTQKNYSQYAMLSPSLSSPYVQVCEDLHGEFDVLSVPVHVTTL